MNNNLIMGIFNSSKNSNKAESNLPYPNPNLINIENISESPCIEEYKEILENLEIVNNKEILSILLNNKRVDLRELMKYINNKNKEISILGLLLLKANYSYIFNRKFITNFFYYNNPLNHIEGYSDYKDKVWDLQLNNNKQIYISIKDNELLKEINEIIYKDFNYIFSKLKIGDINNIEKKNLVQIYFIDSLLILLCNLYDLDSHFYEYYFQNTWINLFTKFFSLFSDFTNLPDVEIGTNDTPLINFLKLFSLCMTKDDNFQFRMNLLKKNSLFLYKILLIATYQSKVCCCFHNLNERAYSCQKALDSILQLMSYIEKNNDFHLLEKVKDLKIKYATFLMNKYGKNICGVYLNRLVGICSNKDIFIQIYFVIISFILFLNIFLNTI